MTYVSQVPDDPVQLKRFINMAREVGAIAGLYDGHASFVKQMAQIAIAIQLAQLFADRMMTTRNKSHP